MKPKPLALWGMLFGVLWLLTAVQAIGQRAPETEGCDANAFMCRVNVKTDGTQSTGHTGFFAPFISQDGRFIGFESSATNLVNGDTNGQTDVFAHDRQTGETTRVSVATGGTQTGGANLSDMSDDGRIYVIKSAFNNLVANDTNGAQDIFVHDRQTTTTTRVNVASNGTQTNTGSVTDHATISGDGRYVAFVSDANNLVPNDTNNKADVFLHDRQTNTTTRLIENTSASGTFDSLSLSSSGNTLALRSNISNLVAGDTNNVADAFFLDVPTQTMERASVASDGTQGNGPAFEVGLSPNGEFVIHTNSSTNLVPGDTNSQPDIFVYNVLTGETARVSVPNGGGQANTDSSGGNLSSNGRFLSFISGSSNLVSGDTNANTDVFVHDRQTGQTRRISITNAGAQTNGFTGIKTAISSDGRFVSFMSSASDLVTGDTNNAPDYFVADLLNFPGSVTPTPTHTATNTATATHTPSHTPTITNTPLPNLLLNGDFNNGQANWSVVGSATSRVLGGVFEFFFNQALEATRPAVLQLVPQVISANTALEASFDLGNSGTVRRRTLIILHNSDFTDFRVCDFWLPPNTALRRYTMRMFNSIGWNGINLAFYDTIKSAAGFLRLDNVTLNFAPGNSTTRVDCIDPSAPNAGAGADGANMVTNGDFAAGLPPWGTFGSITHRLVGGVFEYFYNNALGTTVASVLQNTGIALPANAPLEVRVQLGNNSSQRKRVLILLHNANFDDIRVCDFWLLPNTALQTYVLQTHTTKAWTNAALSLNNTNRASIGFVRIDAVVYRHRPALNVDGSHCFEPSGAPADADAGGISYDFVIEAPTLEPTATPRLSELPPPDTATPPADTSGEGAGEGMRE